MMLWSVYKYIYSPRRLVTKRNLNILVSQVLGLGRRLPNIWDTVGSKKTKRVCTKGENSLKKAKKFEWVSDFGTLCPRHCSDQFLGSPSFFILLHINWMQVSRNCELYFPAVGFIPIPYSAVYYEVYYQIVNLRYSVSYRLSSCWSMLLSCSVSRYGIILHAVKL